MKTMRRNGSRRITLLAAGATVVLSCATAFAAEPKNVIVMISDGQGFNTVKATDYYTGSTAVYENSDFVKFGMQTNSANNLLGYNPAGMAGSFNYAKTTPMLWCHSMPKAPATNFLAPRSLVRTPT